MTASNAAQQMGIHWSELASFLTALAKPEAMTTKVFSSGFPKPDQGVGRPLPEDFFMRGQVWIHGFFSNKVVRGRNGG